ncbi:MAG: 8-amino-7-oxononanoate synthase [Anaerohalosphaeraceae bacterium]|nr:8-amino-7-oxononanoate synthase [Anaerohalosphaeraceae bacterium]
MSNFDWLKTELELLKSNDMLRTPLCIDSAQGPVVSIGGEEKVLFCSNNYLNLANDPVIVAAAEKSLKKFGYGSAASRLLSGTMAPHIELEGAIANLLEKQATLVFGSGFTTNQALIKTLPQKGDLLLLDKLDHASIMDAGQNCAADFRTYRRGDDEKLEKLLASEKYNRKFIITESIFSMDGDFAELAKLVELKNKYSAILIVDEAHALGCMGKDGAGLSSKLGLLGEIDIIVGTFSKAAGCTGGFLASEKCVVDYLINKARDFIYTTAPASANCAAAKAAIEIFKAQPQRRQRLKENADYLRSRFKKLGLNVGQSQSHIVPVIIGDNKKTLEISKKLFEAGFAAVAIRPPTVAIGSARLRISLQCDHTKEQIDSLCEAIENARK